VKAGHKIGRGELGNKLPSMRTTRFSRMFFEHVAKVVSRALGGATSALDHYYSGIQP
jgi:hypothetical protein